MLDRGQIPLKTRNDWRWIAILVSPVAAFVATTGTGPLRWVQRPGLKDLWIFALHLSGNGGPWLLLASAAACLAAVLPTGSDAPGARRVPWEIWRYRFLLCWLLFPDAGLTLALSIGQTALCSPVFYFLFARTHSACGLRNSAFAFVRSRAESSGRSFVFADSFFSGNCSRLLCGSWIFNATTGEPCTQYLHEPFCNPEMPCCFTSPWDGCPTSFIARCSR